MNCPACHAPVPPPADPTLRYATCSGCGAAVDLAAPPEGGTVVKTVTRLPPPVDPMIGRDFAGGRYRIDALLGVGGMGRVYKATQRALGRAVALKVLSPEFAKDEQFRRRFDREAGTLASLEHPHIVTVHDVGTEGDTPYIVMSLVTGPKGEPTSLRDLLDGGSIDEEWALRLVQQTCAALEYAHGRGVIHRDIKPGNILIDADGRAKIADFGIARVGVAGDASQLTSTGAVLGTMRYMAPEQMVDSARVDARSDLYSLGVVLYEMLTGEAPVGRFDLPSEAKKGLDRRLDGIVDRALRGAAAQRYQSAAEMARDLSRITTEREYGRLTGGPATTGAGVAAGPAQGGGGGGHGTAGGGTGAGASSSPTGSTTGPAFAAALGSSAAALEVTKGRTRSAWVIPAAVGAAVLVVGVAMLALRDPAPAKPSSAPSNAPVVAVAPAPPAPPPPVPAMGAVEPPREPATPAPAPPESPPVAPPAVAPPGTDDDADPAPAPAMDAGAKLGGTAVGDGLTADEREEIEDAKHAILAVLAEGDEISAEDFDTEDTSLPEARGTDLPGAIAAVRGTLALLKTGNDAAVADRIPTALLPSLAKALGVPAASVRARLATVRYAASRVSAYSTGKAAAVGSDWALVRYEAAGADGASGAHVAVCVREGGVWKVFL